MLEKECLLFDEMNPSTANAAKVGKPPMCTWTDPFSEIAKTSAAPQEKHHPTKKPPEGGSLLCSNNTLPPTVAAGGHGLEGDADVGFAVGFALLRGQSAEPEIIRGGVSDGPFAGFFGQLHQGQALGGLFDL